MRQKSFKCAVREKVGRDSLLLIGPFEPAKENFAVPTLGRNSESHEIRGGRLEDFQDFAPIVRVILLD